MYSFVKVRRLLPHPREETAVQSADRETPVWQLSQSHLNLLSQCPRKFQYRYLDQWGLPTVEIQLEQQTLGSQFHHLIQQQALGLDIQPFLETSSQLRQWFEALQQFPPPLLKGASQHEYQQLLRCQNVTLVAVYDLLIQTPQQAQIVDWKTYRRPRNLEALRQDWQTRLYPYLLVETSAYVPEQVSMLYWFAQVRGGESHYLVLPYDTAQHQQTHQDLMQLLQQLEHNLNRYSSNQDFPPVVAEHCYRPCPFLARCQPPLTSDAVDVDAIAEIPL